MKPHNLFCVFLCLSIQFPSVFGIDDIDMDSTVQFLIQEFRSLRTRVSVLESVIEKQNEIIQIQNDKIVKLDTIVKSGSVNEEEVEKSNYSPRDIENEAKQSRDINTQPLSLELAHRNTLKASKERILKRSIRLAVQPVAFYAYMSAHLHNPGELHTLIFDVTKTNEGNGYHAHLGVFMVPKSGTYFLSWTMGLWYSSKHITELVVNNQAQGAIRRKTNGDDESDSVTGNVVLILNEHDEVFIRTKDYNAGQILSDEYGRSSFSGFLIQ